MRKSVFIALLFIPFLQTGAQTNPGPQLIGEECVRTAAWYTSQSMAWRDLTEKEPGNGMAWLNYFQALRFSRIAAGQSPGTFTLDTLVIRIRDHVGESFEYFYAAFLNDRMSPKAFGYLESAYKLAPERKELYDDFMWYYERSGDASGKAQFASRWLQKGGLVPAVEEMCYNTLYAMPKGSLVITAGYADTYSLWMYQQKSGRHDQVITSLGMLRDPVYRTRLLRDAGWLVPYPGNNTGDDHALLMQLISVNPGKEVYLSLNHDQGLISGLAPDLYLTGLTFRLSIVPIINTGMIYENWNRYRLTEFNRICASVTPGNAPPIMSGYIIPLVVIYRQLNDEGNESEAEEYLGMAEAVARATGRTSALRSIVHRKE